MKKLLSLFAIVALSAVTAHAQNTILAWDVQGATSTAALEATTIDPNLVGDGAGPTDGFNELTRVGVNQTTATNAFTSSNWNLTDTFDQNNKYITFTLQADPGFQVNLASLDYVVSASNTAPNNGRWGFSTDGGTTFTLQTPFTITGTNALATWDFTDVNGITNPIEFRFWAWGATSVTGGASSSAGTVRIGNIAGDDLVVNGEVVPEPSTIGLAALGLLALGGFARRRMRRS
jgi:hypothetical protein